MAAKGRSIMQNAIIANIENKQLKAEVTPFAIGDKVKVYSRIVEGEKTRTQAFEGTVIRIRNANVKTTFTVRKVVTKIGVEKTFVLHSPNMEKLEVLKRGKVRQSKLYYLRDRIGSKATRIKEKA